MKLYLSTLTDDSLRRLATRASVAVATLLVLAKLLAYFKTGSVALLSSLVDSGVDLVASLITAYGVAKAVQPPDREHRFGHGKAEALAASAQALFIAVSSLFLLMESVQRLVSPRALENEEAGYLVMGLAVVMTVFLLALQSYAIARTKSLAITSDRLHYVGDVLINLAVAATFFLQKKLSLYWVDPLFALLIALAMLYGAWRISRRAVNVLMDAELSDKDRNKILKIARAVEGVRGVHDLRTRSDSDHPFIEMHVEMDPSIELRVAQGISEAVCDAIRAAYANADVVIHQDPVGHEEERRDAMIEKGDG